MAETMPRGKAIAWTVASIAVPLSFSLFFANGYIAYWYATTGYQGPPPIAVIMRGSMYGTAPGLWLSVGLWWWLHRKRYSFVDLFAARTDSIGKDVVCGVVLGCLWVVADGLMGYPRFGDMFVLDAAKLQSVPLSLSAGFCEEFLFRGFVILVIMRAGGSRWAQMIWSSVAFGAGHVLWGPWGMFFTLLLGLTLAGVRMWRGNVWAAVVAHSVLNLCIEPGLLNTAMSQMPR